MEKKLTEKLSKLYELSKRGIDGEKINAQQMLGRLLKKYDISIEDIEADKTKPRRYNYSSQEIMRLMKQIIFLINPEVDLYRFRGQRSLYAELSDYEHLRISELIEFHKKNYKEEKKLLLNDFFVAYVNKQDLLLHLPGKENENEEAIDWEEIQRQIKLMNRIEKRSPLRKITA